MEDMPIEQKDGSKGLLYDGRFGDYAKKELPMIDVDDVKDQELRAALFRDYSFIASAYILEPCDISFKKTKNYGLGRDHLPKNIAVPFCKLADQLGCNPFLEYSSGYTMYNFKKINPKGELNFDNITSHRTFTGKIDEKNFMLVHTAMNAYSPKLVGLTVDIMAAVNAKDRKKFNILLKELEE
jgi:indoleamine 2,3-dioxygenase